MSARARSYSASVDDGDELNLRESAGRSAKRGSACVSTPRIVPAVAVCACDGFAKRSPPLTGIARQAVSNTAIDVRKRGTSAEYGCGVRKNVKVLRKHRSERTARLDRVRSSLAFSVVALRAPALPSSHVPRGRPTVRVKGRTHPHEFTTVRDPDFQPERRGRRATMEGRGLCLTRNSPNALRSNI